MTDSEEESTSSENSWPVNEEWLTRVLKSNYHSDYNITVTDFNIVSACQNGINNLSDLIAVSVTFDLEINDGKITKNKDLIIKLLPHDPFSRYFVTEAQFDLREIKFYTKILPDLQQFQKNNIRAGAEPLYISVPICFYTQYSAGTLSLDDKSSPEPPESILVLEDMRPMGYKPAHFKKGLCLIEAESAIKAIAVVHALSLGLKLKEKVDLNEKYPFLFQTSKATESYQQLVEQGLPQLSKFLEQITGREKELTALANIRPQTRLIIEQLLQPVEPMGLITHTDFWCNNLLLRESIDEDRNDNCIILDWQMVTYSQPTNDIALLIISSLPSKVRRENTGKLLDLYYTMLKKNLDSISIDIECDLRYSRQKLEQDYRKSQLLALLLCIGSVDIALGNQEAEQRFLDVISDLYDEGVLNFDEISI